MKEEGTGSDGDKEERGAERKEETRKGSHSQVRAGCTIRLLPSALFPILSLLLLSSFLFFSAPLLLPADVNACH